jgi:hypothetical protein
MNNVICLHHLARLGRAPELLGKKIMTDNENKVFQYEPEAKQYSVQD